MVDRVLDAAPWAAEPPYAGNLIESGPPLEATSTRSELFPFITVIVPVRNEARFIAGTIEQLVDQDYPADRFEVLVVDGRSDDATRAIAESMAAVHPHVKVLDNPGRLSSAARNIGIAPARGELIVVVDGHCELDGRITSATWPTPFGGAGPIAWAGRSRWT